MGILRTLACAIWFADMETTLYLTTTVGGVTPKGYPQLGCSTLIMGVGKKQRWW